MRLFRENRKATMFKIENKFLKSEKKSVSELNELLEALEKCPLRSDFPYKEPSELQGIKAEWPREPERVEITLSDDELYDKIYGEWLGRCAGCLLGKPVEGLNKDQIEEWLKIADAYPLREYFPPLPDLPEDAPDWLKRRSSWLNEALPSIKNEKVKLLLETVLNDEKRHHSLLVEVLNTLVKGETITEDEWFDVIWKNVPFHGSPGG